MALLFNQRPQKRMWKKKRERKCESLSLMPTDRGLMRKIYNGVENKMCFG